MADKRTRGAPHAGDAVYYKPGLQSRWGISAPTFWRWRRAGKLPEPDRCIGGRDAWSKELIERYEART